MAKKDNSGIIRLILVVVLALLVLALISQVARTIFGNFLAEIIITIILILVVLWMLAGGGRRKIENLLNAAGLR